MTVTQDEKMLAMPARIQLPYTLTPGTATGTFLAELSKKRLLASRNGNEIHFPPMEFSPQGEPSSGFVEVPPVGTVVALTTNDEGTLALVQIDGTESPLIHKLVGFSEEELKAGARVQVVWAENPTGDSILDIEGFAPLTDAETFEPRDGVTDTADAIEKVDYTIKLDYEHAYGHHYGTLFDGVKNDRRLRGVKCTNCERVLMPPRAVCDACYAPTGQWIDVASTGTVQASSVVHIEFVGQRKKPPYVYAEIILDGSSTRLIHTIGNVDAEEAKTAAAPGARVRAVWSDRHTGSLADIEYFELITE